MIQVVTKKTKPSMIKKYTEGDYIVYQNFNYKIVRVCRTFIECNDLSFVFPEKQRFYPKHEQMLKVYNHIEYLEKQQEEKENRLMDREDEYRKFYIYKMKSLTKNIDDILDENYNNCVEENADEIFFSKFNRENFIKFCDVCRFEICDEIINTNIKNLEDTFNIFKNNFNIYKKFKEENNEIKKLLRKLHSLGYCLDEDEETNDFILIKKIEKFENKAENLMNEINIFEELKKQMDNKDLLNEFIKRGHFLRFGVDISSVFHKYYDIYENKPLERNELMKKVKEIEDTTYVFK